MSADSPPFKSPRRLANSVAPGAGPSFVNDDFGDVFGLFLALTGGGYELPELKTYAEDLRKELLTLIVIPLFYSLFFRR